MKDSIRQRLEKMVDRFEEVGGLLADPSTDGGSQQFRELSMEYSRLQPLTERFAAYRGLEARLQPPSRRRPIRTPRCATWPRRNCSAWAAPWRAPRRSCAAC